MEYPNEDMVTDELAGENMAILILVLAGSQVREKDDTSLSEKEGANTCVTKHATSR